MSKLGFWNGLKVTGHLYWCAERLHRHSTRFPLCLNDLWRGGSHSEAVPELGSPRRGAGSGWYWVAVGPAVCPQRPRLVGMGTGVPTAGAHSPAAFAG